MFFDKCMNINDLRDRYRLLSKRFHPDLGGTNDLMKELTEEYDNKKYNIEKKEEPLFERRRKEKSKSRSKSISNMDYEDKIETILDWARTNESFDTEFIESLAEQISYKNLSFAQEKAIDNIIKRFRIPL